MNKCAFQICEFSAYLFKTKTYIKTVHNQLVAIMASRQYGKNMQGDKTHSYMKQTYSCIHSNIQPARKI